MVSKTSNSNDILNGIAVQSEEIKRDPEMDKSAFRQAQAVWQFFLFPGHI